MNLREEQATQTATGTARTAARGGQPEQSEESLAARLVEKGRLSAAALERAQRVRETTGEALAGLLLKLGLLSERDLAEALADLHGCKLVTAEDYPAVALFEDRLSTRFLREARILPLHQDSEGLCLAMADPADRFAREAMALVAGVPVHPRVAVPGELEQAIERLYGGGGERLEADGELGDGLDEGLDGDIERLKDMASEAPVVRLVNRIITQAIERRASDIHLEPAESHLRLRYRIDGLLRDGDPPPAQLRAAIVSRIKIMAKLNIAERRLPQDGRIKLAVRGNPVDLRISTLPTLHGESVVMRVLDRESVSLDFGALGIGGENLAEMLRGLERPNGIFLVTGPTGSGKTTTLYAALSRLNDPDRKIVTVEDPIEYQLEGVNQIQVKPAIGMDFAQALRAILRQDPDIILIGEIRDLETAQIAAQAALTGHLVLSTLHTNSAAGSITRLLDMGVEDYLVTATLNGVAAQRLVRRLCEHCKEPYAVEAELAAHIGLEKYDAGAGSTLYKPHGCKHCGDSGYRGRTSLLETLTLNDDLRRQILKDADARSLHHAAVAQGMRTLYDDGMAKAVAGETSVAEVLRVTRDS